MQPATRKHTKYRQNSTLQSRSTRRPGGQPNPLTPHFISDAHPNQYQPLCRTRQRSCCVLQQHLDRPLYHKHHI